MADARIPVKATFGTGYVQQWEPPRRIVHSLAIGGWFGALLVFFMLFLFALTVANVYSLYEKAVMEKKVTQLEQAMIQVIQELKTRGKNQDMIIKALSGKQRTPAKVEVEDSDEIDL